MAYFISFFFFNDTATTEIYTLPYTTLFRSVGAMSRDFEELDYRKTPLGELILRRRRMLSLGGIEIYEVKLGDAFLDRKSTRLNSSHLVISYAVFCLKKKKLYILCHCNITLI